MRRPGLHDAQVQFCDSMIIGKGKHGAEGIKNELKVLFKLNR